MITCKSGITIRMAVSGISELGRATQGVKLIKISEDDEIAAITSIDEQEELVEEGDFISESIAENNVTDSPADDATPKDNSSSLDVEGNEDIIEN